MMMKFEHKKVDLGYEDLVAITKPEGRKYVTPDHNKYYPSITTILSHKSKPGIEAWKKRIGYEEAAKILRKAYTRGTAVHLLIEKYLQNEKNCTSEFMPDIVGSFMDLKPFFDNRIGTIYGQEMALYSDHFGVAGRVDCVAEFDGKMSIIDFKTSLKPKKKEWVESYFMQECFYAIAFEERTKIPVTQLVTIIAVDNSTPELYIEHRDDWVEPLREVIKEYNTLV